jgi:adenylate cyclase
MSEVVQRNGGYLNKFIGDGMLVLFGVPLSSGAEDDACRAVQAAVEMVQRVEELNARQKSARPKFKIGVGIHTGPLTVGNVGARDRLEYSVIGETVNLSSRLESLNKEFNTSIVLSPQTRDLVKDRFAPVRLGQVTVRGFSEAIQVYTVPQGAPPEAKG